MSIYVGNLNIQIPHNAGPELKRFVNHCVMLKDAIEGDNALSSEQKSSALELLGKTAEVANSPKDDSAISKSKRALSALRDSFKVFPQSAESVTAAKENMPELATFLG